MHCHHLPKMSTHAQSHVLDKKGLHHLHCHQFWTTCASTTSRHVLSNNGHYHCHYYLFHHVLVNEEHPLHSTTLENVHLLIIDGGFYLFMYIILFIIYFNTYC